MKIKKPKLKAPELPEWTWRLHPHTYAKKVSEGTWQDYRWLCDLGNIAMDTVLAHEGRLIVNAPPRHGKSWLLSKWLPIWLLDIRPYVKIVIASYGNELAREFGRLVRDELRTNKLIRVKLREDADAAGHWVTPEGGGMQCVGINSPITGFGYDLAIIDDPIKDWTEAHSPTYRNKLKHWFRSTFDTRAEPGASIIVTMTRWHKKDFTDFLMREHDIEWKHIKADAIAETDDPVFHRKKGEALCPERYDTATLLRRKASAGFAWWPLYQQAPKLVNVGAAYERYHDGTVDDSIELNTSEPLCLMLDFNINPGMHGEIGHYDSIDDVFDVVHEIFDHGLSLQKLLQRFIAFYHKMGPFPSIHVYGDPAGGARSIETGHTRIDVIRQALTEAGLPNIMRFASSHPSPIDVINSANEALRDFEEVPHVRVHSRCERLLNDFENVVWNDAGTNVDKSDKMITHASEAFGHWVHRLRRVRSPKRMQGPGTGARIILG